jgi:hypothetical protein
MTDDTYDLSPDKLEMFKSQSGDLSLIDAVKELVDNAIDNWTRTTDRDENATVRIDIDESTTRVWDNTGGVPSDEIQALFAPGEAREEPPEWSIGGYALGAKKAISRLGGLGEGAFNLAHIKSRTIKAEKAYGYNIDRNWFEKSEWDVERKTFSNLQDGCTEVVVGASEQLWNDNNISELQKELSRTYTKFLAGDAHGQSADFKILLGGEEIEPAKGVEWSYIPLDDLYPRRYTNIELDASYLSTPIQIQLEVGLMLNKDAQEAGTDIYFQDRLVINSSTSEEGGFGTDDSALGHFTPKNERFKARIELITEGDASDLPWDTQKKNIDRTSRISSLMYSRVKKFAEPYFSADSDVVSDAIAIPYHKGSKWAANSGAVKEVDVGETNRPDCPRTNLRDIEKLRKWAGYHVTQGVFIDYESHDYEKSGLIDQEAVPAYTELVFELTDDDLDGVSPEEGKKIIENVKALRKTLRSIRNIRRSAVDDILDSGYISEDDLREASTRELQRINGVGNRTAQRIKDRVEPSEGIKEILKELSSCPTDERGNPNAERVFEIYEKLLEFDSLPSQNDIDAVVDDALPFLTDDGEYADASAVFIPDQRELSTGFADVDEIRLIKMPEPECFDIQQEDLYDLFTRLGGTRISKSAEESVFYRGSENVDEQDSTPRKRLDDGWDSIENELSNVLSSQKIERPSIVWVEETGIQYTLNGSVYEKSANCKYDPNEGEVYLTPDFVVDWEALAAELAEAHSGSIETIETLLKKGSGELEDQSVDIVRQLESDEFRKVVDVRNDDVYDGEDVRGCDVIAIPYGNGDPRFIEIKSRSSSQTPIHLIGHEPEKAEDLQRQYYVYIVVINEVTDSTRLWRLSNPADRDFKPEDAWRINQSTWQEEGEEIVIQ